MAVMRLVYTVLFRSRAFRVVVLSALIPSSIAALLLLTVVAVEEAFSIVPLPATQQLVLAVEAASGCVKVGLGEALVRCGNGDLRVQAYLVSDVDAFSRLVNIKLREGGASVGAGLARLCGLKVGNKLVVWDGVRVVEVYVTGIHRVRGLSYAVVAAVPGVQGTLYLCSQQAGMLDPGRALIASLQRLTSILEPLVAVIGGLSVAVGHVRAVQLVGRELRLIYEQGASLRSLMASYAASTAAIAALGALLGVSLALTAMHAALRLMSVLGLLAPVAPPPPLTATLIPVYYAAASLAASVTASWRALKG